MTTFNGEKYVEEQVRSIFHQTHPPTEVIAVDDCSDDDSYGILVGLSKIYPNLTAVKNEQRLGLVANFEKAMSLCTSEFIATADQDDIWMPRKISELLNNIGAADLVYSDAEMFQSETGASLGLLSQENRLVGLTSANPDFIKVSLYDSFIWGMTTLFRRDLLKRALPIGRTYRNHDWWLAMVAAQGRGVAYVDLPLVRYRIHDLNYSREKTKHGLMQKAVDTLRGDRIEQKLSNATKSLHLYKTVKERNLISSEASKYLDEAMHIQASLISRQSGVYRLVPLLMHFPYSYRSKSLRERLALLASKVL